MGIRETQLMGLPTSAKEFLVINAIVKDKCSHCGRYDGYVYRKLGKYGMFDEYNLREYDLKNGEKATEFIQREAWSSGPMIWLGLKTKDKLFKWKEKDMEED